jgi:hypothetical protein
LATEQRKRIDWQRRQAGGEERFLGKPASESAIFPINLEQNSSFVPGFVLFSAAIKFSGSRLNPFQFFWNCRLIEILISLQESRFFAIIF